MKSNHSHRPYTFAALILLISAELILLYTLFSQKLPGALPSFQETTALAVNASDSNSKSFIKWVDFDVTAEAMRQALRLDVDSYNQTPHLNWLELLAYSGARCGGDFSRYRASDMDMMGQIGTPIIAVESGYVEAIGWNQYGGWRLGIRSFDKKRYYYYAHLRKNYPYHKTLQEGSYVQAGDVIGYLGRTGYSRTENTNNIRPGWWCFLTSPRFLHHNNTVLRSTRPSRSSYNHSHQTDTTSYQSLPNCSSCKCHPHAHTTSHSLRCAIRR